ncbi:MAG TPA: TonB-dependent receptor, partial [Candidatus Polarisedimenticolia bacterium]|nr:TonB-dependent receptor [Candidatus Polarisedimenticolia bacterium]
ARSGSLRGVAWVDLASTRIVYRADSLPLFRPRRGQARGGMGARFALGPSAGLGLDAAYDARQAEPGFLDGRASLWGGTERARGRLDLESAHERATWVDLFTPPTLHSFFSPVGAIQTTLIRAGDPTLKPRALRGGLGFLNLTLGRGMDLELSGSYRRVTDDFGWDVTTDTTGGFLTVRSLARRRGDGWLSHAAIGWDLRRGFLRARGVAWVRGGADSLSPRAGSPARRAVDAALEARLVLFKGDLPLTFGVESHACGPRRGLIREPGQVTWDGTLSADFGPAGAFLRIQDVFDRRPGSAIWDPVVPSGAPMPGRTFQAGVVWNLLD